LTLIGDRNYWKNNLNEDLGVMQSLKRLVSDDSVDFDKVISSMTGVARHENDVYHVCFRICNIRGYFDCLKGKGTKMFTMVSVWGTC
jgi:hypothetical protein